MLLDNHLTAGFFLGNVPLIVLHRWNTL